MKMSTNKLSDNRIMIDGEVFYTEDASYVSELFATGGMHVTDRYMDSAILRIDHDYDQETKVMYALDELVSKYEPEELESFEADEKEAPEEREDLFLDVMGILAKGSPKQKRQLAQLVKQAYQAFADIEAAGREEGLNIICSIATNRPGLFSVMQALKNVS